MRLIAVLAVIALLLGVPLPAAAESATPVVASPVPVSDHFERLVDIGGGRRL
jgi:hypothetical protein